MNRFVSPDLRPTVFEIAHYIKGKHPNDFVPIKRVIPHVGILTIKTALTYTRRAGADDLAKAPDVKKVQRTMADIRRDLPVSSLQSIFATYIGVDRIGKGLGLMLESAEASEEIEFARRTFGKAVGVRLPAESEPFVLVGFSSGSVISNPVLATAGEACNRYLPKDKQIGLEPVTSTRPGRR